MERVELTLEANTKSIKAADKDLDKFNKTGKETDKVIDDVTDSVDDANKTIDVFDKRVRDTKRAVEEAEKALDDTRRQLDTTREATGASGKQFIDYRAEITEARQELRRKKEEAREAAKVQKAAAREIAATEKAANDEIARSARQRSQIITQAGFQVQDSIVQLQMGTSAFVVAAQQAPQFAGIFGPTGAIAGAFIAGAATLGGIFLPSLFETMTAVDQLEASLEKLGETVTQTEDGTKVLTEEFAKLAEESRDLANIALTSQLTTALDASKQAAILFKGSLDELSLTVRTSGRGIGATTTLLSDITQELGITADQARELRSSAKEAFTTLEDDAISEFSEVLARVSRQTESSNTAFFTWAQSVGESVKQLADARTNVDFLQSSLSDLDNALATSTQSAIESAERSRQAALNAVFREDEQIERSVERLRNAGITRAEQIQLNYNKELEVIKAGEDSLTLTVTEAAKLRLQAEERFIKQKEDLRQQDINSILSASAQALSVLEDGLKEGTAAQKAAFIAQQGIAISSIIVSTQDAATKALTAIPGPGGILLSNTIQALGAASAGIAAGQTIAGVREQGGQVRAGQSYLVGERGPELLTMGPRGGNITPNNQMNGGASANIEVISNVQIIGGDQNANVRTETRQISDKQFIIDTIVEQNSNTSSRGFQALRNNSSIQPRGQF